MWLTHGMVTFAVCGMVTCICDHLFQPPPLFHHHQHSTTSVVVLPLVWTTLDTSYCHITAVASWMKPMERSQQGKSKQGRDSHWLCPLPCHHLNNANHEWHTHSSKQGTVPMPHMWHGTGELETPQTVSAPCCCLPSFANTLFADQEPQCSQDNEREGTVPMPFTWHGYWGMGNTPTRWVPHDAVAIDPPFANPSFAD